MHLSTLLALGSQRRKAINDNDMQWPTLQNVLGPGERTLRSPAFRGGQGNNHTRLAAHGWISYLQKLESTVNQNNGVKVGRRQRCLLPMVCCGQSGDCQNSPSSKEPNYIDLQLNEFYHKQR